jgi:hypothetical protein
MRLFKANNKDAKLELSGAIAQKPAIGGHF